MTKQLYEEALADVRKVKQVAEDNAKRAVLEAVTPRIREFIDQALLRENDLEVDDIEIAAPGTPQPQGELMTDLVTPDPRVAVPVDNAGPAAAITPPDAEGKVTLDIDSLCSSEPGTPVPPPMFGAIVPEPEDTEYEISLESIEALQPVLSTVKKPVMTLDKAIEQIVENIVVFKGAGKAVRATKGYHEQIAQMISRVENIYDYVQEQLVAGPAKNSYETMLEASFKDLNKLQESTTMSKKTNKGRINEESEMGSEMESPPNELTLKLTGLPDDIDLDSVGVDLITGDGDGDEDEEGGDLEGGDQAGFGDDMDLGGQQGMQGGDQMETRNLSDDTIVEIDEKMLRREIARMRNLREDHTGTGGSETKPQSWGNGSGGSNILDDFGGGADEGEAHEQDIVDQSPAKGALPLGEGDDDLDEQQDQMDEAEEDQMDEADGLSQAIDGPEHGGNDSTPSNKQSRQPGESFSVSESKKRLDTEKKFQARAKSRASFLKKEAARAKGGKLLAIKKEYASVATRYNESLTRSKKITQRLAEATQKLQRLSSNSSVARPAENTAVDSLRKKLAETNLFNAKLLYTNQLLQNEQLTSRQKSQVIKQLDQAKTIREAKLVYESLSSTLASNSKSVNESADRQVLGSGSRVTRPATTQALNEGYEAERWAQLAGITKR